LWLEVFLLRVLIKTFLFQIGSWVVFVWFMGLICGWNSYRRAKEHRGQPQFDRLSGAYGNGKPMGPFGELI